MNELLRRVVLDAELTELELSARVLVDVCTVREWLRGDLPIPHHRAALIRLLGVNETELWPDLPSQRSEMSWSAEIVAAYPRRASISREHWLSLVESATREIGIVARTAHFLARDYGIMRLLSQKAAAGIHIRLALSSLDGMSVAAFGAGDEPSPASAAELGGALALWVPLTEHACVELRLHNIDLYNSMYRFDAELLVNQHAYGVPPAESPTLHYRRAEGGEILQAYLTSFEAVWAGAKPCF